MRSATNRQGTRKATILRRRTGSAKAARLKLFLRRFGLYACGTVFILWLVAWVWLSGLAAQAAHGVTQDFYRLAAAQGFTVQNIYVQGRENTDPDLLRALLSLERGDPIFAFDPREAQEMISRVSWVKEAQVARYLPDTVYINIVERQPLALWQHKGKVRLIDSEGVTVAASRMDRFAGLILLVGEEAPAHAPDLIALLDAEPLLKERVEAATRVGARRWDLRLRNGMTVKLPEKDMGLALRRLAQAQEEDGLLDKDLTMIDARDAVRFTVRTRPGAVKLYQAGLRGDI